MTAVITLHTVLTTVWITAKVVVTNVRMPLKTVLIVPAACGNRSTNHRRIPSKIPRMTSPDTYDDGLQQRADASDQRREA
jgi:hypothetical protein